MLDIKDPEDRQIRVILLSAAALVLAVVLSSALTLAVMVSLNFNFLNWME